MKTIFTIFSAVFMAALSAAEDPALLFEATYETDGDKAEFARGDKRAYAFVKEDRTLNKVDGLKPGTKALVRTNAQRLFYKAPGNFTAAQGTISFWFQMVNYDLENDDLQTIFSVIDNHKRKWPNAFHLRILKNKKEWKNFIVAQIYYKDDKQQNPLNIQTQQYTGLKKWKAGEWHNITITWDNKQMCLYLDGVADASNHGLPGVPPNVPVRKYDFQFPEMSNEARIFIGNYFKAKDCSSAFDQIRIYNKALTAAEVKALVEKDLAAK